MSFKVDFSGSMGNTPLTGIIGQTINKVNAELPARAAAASNELRNTALEVLRGKRSGRVYRTPTGARYTASAPGEPPAVRTGTLRLSWRSVQYGANHQNPAIESNTPYAWLDQGGGKIAARPYSKKIIEMAKPKVEAIYAKPFNISP